MEQREKIDPRWRAVELKTGVHPPMRYKSTAVSMPEFKRLYMFGGLGAKPSNDLWMLDLESRDWTLVRVSGPRPSPRLYHTMTYDEDSTFYVFAGQETPQPHEMTPKSEQEGRELRYKAYQRRPLLADIWEFNVKDSQWCFHQCPGKQPAPRRGHTTLLLKDRANSAPEEPQVHTRRASNFYGIEPVKKPSTIRELLVIGGAMENRRGYEVGAGDIWSLDLDKMVWQQLHASGSFTGRFDHTATRIGRRIFIVGGVSTTSAEYVESELQRHWGNVQRDIMSLDIDTLTWVRIETNPFGDLPSLALHGHSAVQDPSEGGENTLLIFGGRATDSWTSDVMKYDTLSCAWSVLPVTSLLAPPPRHGHVCLVYKQDKKPVNPSLALRGNLKKAKRTERNLLLGLTAALPPPPPLLRMPCLLVFGGSLLDGSPGYESGHIFSLEWTVPGPDSPSGTPRGMQSMCSSLEGGPSFMPSLMEGGSRPHTAPTFSRSMSSVRNSLTKGQLSVRGPVPWEYQEVKAMLRRQQQAGGRSRQQQQQALTPLAVNRKPVTAPAKMQSHYAGGSKGATEEEQQQQPKLNRLGKLEMPSTEELIMLAGKRFGLVQDQHHHPHHHHQHGQGVWDERLTIFEKKRMYFEKLRRMEKAAQQQQERAIAFEHQHHQHHQSPTYLHDHHQYSASYATLPTSTAMPTSRSLAAASSSAAAPRPATATGSHRPHHHHHQEASSTLSILGAGSWSSRGGSTTCVDWHVISRHTPTVSLGR